MKWKSVLLMAFILALIFEGNAEVTKVEGVTFARYGTRELQLDLFKPAKQTELRPAVVCIHGGGWRTGNRKHFNRVAHYLAERNYTVVSISYRLSGEAPFPAQIQDCKAAVRWIRANAETHGIDPQRIGVIGHSAGGHLAALLATSAGNVELEGDGGNTGFSSAVQAAVPMGAQSDLETDRIRSMTALPSAEIWHAFLGGSLDENEAIYRLASPRRHLDKTDPPMLFITGAHDNLDTHADPIRGDMKRLNIPAELLILPDAPHAFLSDQESFETALSSATAFFDTNLSTRPLHGGGQ
jgi:arylsulfatase A